MSNAVQSEKSGELLTDSSISKSFHTDQGRELKPWIPDGDVPQGLDNVFDDPWKRYIYIYTFEFLAIFFGCLIC